MRICILIAAVTCGAINLCVAEQGSSSPLNGTWVTRMNSTTPHGFHYQGTSTVVLDARGTCTETLEQVLEYLSPQGRPLAPKWHIVAKRHSLRATIHGDTLVIRWSPLKMVTGLSDKLPAQMDTRVDECTASYSRRGKKLRVTFDTGETETYTRSN
jgi:hypothetical protein